MRIFSIGLLILLVSVSAVTADNRVVDAARDYVVERFNVDETSITVTMRQNRSFDDLLPGDSLKVYSTNSTFPRGSYPLRFDIVRDGVVVKTISASVKVDYWADVYVPTKKIRRGEELSVGDFVIERREVTRSSDKIVEITQSLTGNRAATTIPSGKTLEKRMIEPIPTIYRGDEVRIRCDIGQMQITTIGIAKDDGCLGDQIDVMNKDTRKRIVAEVKAPGLVEVRR